MEIVDIVAEVATPPALAALGNWSSLVLQIYVITLITPVRQMNVS